MTQPQLVVRFMSAKDDKMLSRSLIIGSLFIFIIVGSAYTVGAFTNVYFFENYGEIAYVHVTQGVDFIIPNYVFDVFSGFSFGDVFVCIFLLSLLSAAISTLSALMHTIGAAGGHDLYTLLRNRNGTRKLPRVNLGGWYTELKNRTAEKGEDYRSLSVNRIVTAIVMVLVVVYCYLMPNDIIAKATSLFMGITAAALLPLMAYGLYAKRPKKWPAILSVSVGTAAYLIWALFINQSSSIFLPICKWVTGNPVLFMNSTVKYVDALIVALPLSLLTLAIVYLVMWLRNNGSGEKASADDEDGT
jgi:SSS family solute:Na+ symporter